MGGDDRNLLDLQYPTRPAPRAFHRPRHPQRSSQRRLGHRPVHTMSVGTQLSFCRMSRAGRWSLAKREDGAVPLERCLWKRRWRASKSVSVSLVRGASDSHQETGLSARAVSDYNKFSLLGPCQLLSSIADGNGEHTRISAIMAAGLSKER